MSRIPHIKPMLLQAAKIPPSNKDYRFEIKWDGYRALIFLDHGKIRIQSRQLRDMTTEFPELHSLAHKYRKRRLVIDGEVVALGPDGKPEFHAVRNKPSMRNLAFIAFDLLHLDGRCLMNRPYAYRRAALQRLRLKGSNWDTAQSFQCEGDELLATTKSLGLEGIVAKRLDSRYEPGARSKHWLKIKNFKEQQLILGGLLPPTNSRGWVMLVGKRAGDRLSYAGPVELGIGSEVADQLTNHVVKLASRTNPFEFTFRKAFFVKPTLSVVVRHTVSGSSLREAYFKRFA
jgi:bifunctional non-homologous end joining protein LigD